MNDATCQRTSRNFPTISEVYASAWISRSLSSQEHRTLTQLLRHNYILPEERLAVDRLLYAQRRGWVKEGDRTEG